MSKNNFLTFLLLVGVQVFAQNVTGKIVDSTTGESIPYANITVSDASNLVSNAEGYFTIPESNTNDSTVLTITYLGYVGRRITLNDLKNQNTISLVPAIYELDDVNVGNVRPNANAIMAQVKLNLPRNYKNNETTKDKLFRREASAFQPKVFDVEITKSTGFSKKALVTANAQFKDFTSNMIANPSRQFTDMVCNSYTTTKDVAGKPVLTRKLEVVKATKLHDETKSTSIDEMQTMATNILLKHLDTTKYYRIKSGLFGSRDTLSLRKDFVSKKRKDKPKKNNLTAVKNSMLALMTETDFANSPDVDFIKDSDIYDYTYEGSILSNQNEFVYVLTFKPRKSKANFTGKIFVSQSDFAVVRAEYKLAKGKTLHGFNMKLLLGVKALDNLSTGTLIYKQNASGEGYYLQYASIEEGQYIYLNRPLKFIELTDDDEDVVAFDLKVEGSIFNKSEYLNIARNEVSDATFEKVAEDDFKYISLKRYDPSIWKDYGAIEPLEEMKQFRISE